MDNYYVQKKSDFWPRVGFFFLALLPPISSIIMQLLCGLAVVIAAFVAELLRTEADLTDQVAVMQLYMQVVYDKISIGVGFYHVVGTILFGIWYYFSYHKPRPTLGGAFKKLTAKNVTIAVIGGAFLNFFAQGTVAIEYALLPDMVNDYVEAAEISGVGINAFVIFGTIFLAPIGEEFVCRGLCLNYGQKCFKRFWIANILQALLFGLMHANWVQGIYAFVLGLVMGWLVKRYDSLLIAMLVHFVVNLSGSTWIPWLLTALGVPMNLAAGLVMTLVPAAIVAILLIWAGKKDNTAAPS